MKEDHATTPATYEYTGTCDGCGKPIRRVLKYRRWSEIFTEDAFPIECRNCGAHSMAYPTFDDQEAA